MQTIPRNIEVLIKKAAVDAAFKQTLLAKRSAAATEIELTLTPAEAKLLDSIPAEQLAAIIASTKVEASALPALLGKVAAAMLIALGVTSAVSQVPMPAPTGVRPDVPKTQPATASAPTTAPKLEPRGIRPDVPIPTPMPATTSAPASQPSPKVMALIAKLDADDYKDRQAAQDELERMGKAIIDDLKLAQKNASLSAEARHRVTLIVEKLDPQPPTRIEAVNGIRANVAGLPVGD